MIKIVKTITTTEYIKKEEMKSWLTDLMEAVGYDEHGVDNMEAVEYYLTEDNEPIGRVYENKTSKVEFENKEEIEKMLEDVKAYWKKEWGD